VRTLVSDGTAGENDNVHVDVVALDTQHGCERVDRLAAVAAAPPAGAACSASPPPGRGCG